MTPLDRVIQQMSAFSDTHAPMAETVQLWREHLEAYRAALEAQEPAMEVVLIDKERDFGGHKVYDWKGKSDFPVGTKFYARPIPPPDVRELVEAAWCAHALLKTEGFGHRETTCRLSEALAKWENKP